MYRIGGIGIRVLGGLALCALIIQVLKAQDISVPSRQSIDKTLSLRLKPRSIIYERSTPGNPLKISNGATVWLQNGAVQGVVHSDAGSTSIKLVPAVPITADMERKHVPISPIEMRVWGQCIYLDRLVDLLVVQDITGRTIKILLKGNKMKLDDLRSGVYIVRVQDKGLTHTSKFILR